MRVGSKKGKGDELDPKNQVSPRPRVVFSATRLFVEGKSELFMKDSADPSFLVDSRKGGKARARGETRDETLCQVTLPRLPATILGARC